MSNSVRGKATEDSSVNSLGVIPMGALRRKSKVRRRVHASQRVEHMTLASKLLKTLAEADGEEQVDLSRYTKLSILGEFDANRIPEIKQAVTQAVGSGAELKYDNVENAFYVGGTDEVVQQIADLLKGMGIEVEMENASPTTSQVTPGVTPTNPPPANNEVIPQVMTTAKESSDDMAPLVADDGEDSTSMDPNPDTSDDDIFNNGRLSDVMHRTLNKISRLSGAKRADAYRALMLQVMDSVQGKSGAPQAMLQAIKGFWKSEL